MQPASLQEVELDIALHGKMNNVKTPDPCGMRLRRAMRDGLLLLVYTCPVEPLEQAAISLDLVFAVLRWKSFL